MLSFQKKLNKTDRGYIRKIVESIESLSFDPGLNACKKLAGSDHTYRLRVGDYRVIYTILDKKLHIVVIRVRHRQSAYD